MAAGLVLGLLVTIWLVVLAAAGADHAPSTVIDVVVSGVELTVDVRHAPLARVLEIIGERAGVEVTLHGDVNAPITRSFTGLPLVEGIRELARGYSVIVTYGIPSGESGHATVTGVWVMGSVPGARASSESRAASPVEEQANPRVAEAADAAALASPIGEIQRLAVDADRGSEAAMARLAEIGASDADAALREQAVAALGRLTSPGAEPLLVAALADVDVSVRVRAIRGLRTFDTETAAASLADVLIADVDPRVRLAALAAVGSLSGPRVPTMLEKASTDPDVTVRETAVRWLAWWRSRVPAAP